MLDDCYCELNGIKQNCSIDKSAETITMSITSNISANSENRLVFRHQSPENPSLAGFHLVDTSTPMDIRLQLYDASGTKIEEI